MQAPKVLIESGIPTTNRGIVDETSVRTVTTSQFGVGVSPDWPQSGRSESPYGRPPRSAGTPQTFMTTATERT